MQRLSEFFRNVVGAIANRFHKSQPNTWSGIMPKAKSAPYLSPADQAVIQATIREAADESGEGFMFSDDVVLKLTQKIVANVNAKH
jgi:hypothetical protein